MNTVCIPYALGNLATFTFKEISYGEYARYLRASSDLKKIYQERYSDEVHIGSELAKLSNELRKKHAQAEPLYIKAKQNLDNFKKQNRSILIKGASLEEAESFEKLSWVFSISSKEQDLAKHYAKYKHVYDQLRVLQGEVSRLQPYSKEFIRETMYQEERKARNALEYHNEKSLEQWNERREKKIQEQSRILAPTSGYGSLIHNLSVVANGMACNISCTAIPIYGGQQQTIRQTLINKSVQILR